MRKLVSSGSPFEPTIGFSRAVRTEAHVFVSGTAAIGADGKTVGIGDAAAQARRVLEIIKGALEDAGASLSDVVRTRIFLAHMEEWETVARVHGEVFSDIRPATYLGKGKVAELAERAQADEIALVVVDAVRLARLDRAAPSSDSRPSQLRSTDTSSPLGSSIPCSAAWVSRAITSPR